MRPSHSTTLASPRSVAAPALSGLGERELVEAIAAGDSAALAEVYLRYGARVRSVASRLCGQARSDDLTQEIFLQLWRRPDRFDPDRGSLVRFLLTQTHSRAIDVLRSEAARHARELAETLERPATEIGVEAAVLSALVVDEVEQMLRALPHPERHAIVLAFFADLTYREVATLLGEPEGTVKSRIRTGLARLRTTLDDDTR